jgi:CBS domain-containing protein
MNELQYKMKAKSRYQPSKTVEALFTTALVKIKADTDKAVAKQKAMSETEVVSAKAGVEAKAKESILEQKVEPETDSFDQTGTNGTKSEAKPVSRKETTEAFESETEQEAGAGEQKVEDAVTAFGEVSEEKVELEVETEAAVGSSVIKPETESFDQTGTNEMKSEAEPDSRKEIKGTFESKAEQEVGAVEQKAEDADTAFEDVVEIKAESQESAAGEVSRSIRQMAQSQSNQPREQSLAGSGLCAKDVMLKELVWGSPEESVRQAITKMPQCDSGYLMVGMDGVLEGIVSNSNIKGALSPYLRPVFAKWRRPLDDATLQIRIKWIMSRPVHIVKPETPLANVMENMCRYGVLCLPVVDQQGKVQGLVTEAGIFKVLLGLKSSPGISISGNEHKEQSTFNHREIESTQTMESNLVAPV